LERSNYDYDLMVDLPINIAIYEGSIIVNLQRDLLIIRYFSITVLLKNIFLEQLE